MVESNKIISELKDSPYEIHEIYTLTPELFDSYEEKVIEINEIQLKKISFLQNPKDSLALVRPLEASVLETSINLILDNLQDPGNLGTIIRLADWFGIEQIICSNDTVDYRNPKVIQASMGSFVRVNMLYTELSSFLEHSKLPTFGTDMVGMSIYQKDYPQKMNIIMGNEGNGISKKMENYIDEMLTIPRFGSQKSTESLNVSMATGIILGEIFGRQERNSSL